MGRKLLRHFGKFVISEFSENNTSNNKMNLFATTIGRIQFAVNSLVGVFLGYR